MKSSVYWHNMSFKHRLVHHIESMWWEREKPPWYVRLWMPLYRTASTLDQKKRLDKSVQPPIPMISIGNITVGGSGKTPFVIWLAKALKQHGYQPVLICRGDGGHSSNPILLHQNSLATDVGDEAVLLHRMSGCPVISAQNRVQASRMAAEYGDVILLDDGFQYRQLERVCDVVLIPDVGVGNGCVLPAGPLREPILNLKRADVVVRVGQQANVPLSEHKEWHWHTLEYSLRDWMQCHQACPNMVHAVTAIARPQRFVESLTHAGFKLSGQTFFPDHYAFKPTDISTFQNLPHPIAVTAKDAVKLEALWNQDTPLWVLEQTAVAETDLFERIESMLPSSHCPRSC
ncbi:MAG: tetraacyldisaccharide 4'-kinase [Mariprofundaceae bacterium]|nr:tetraacyldisaccharide 4'-kinase [Mariprofundaceae bacterium]